MKRKADQEKESEESEESEKAKKPENNPSVSAAESAIAQLPTELKVLIFSSLETKTLSTAGLVCQEWNNLSQDPWLWKERINVHFPYLAQTRKEAYTDNPRELYRKEYERYKSLKASKGYSFSLQQLLDALSGQLSEIESHVGLDELSKQALYAHAVANGHYHGLTLLAKSGDALILAAEHGHLLAVQYLLLKVSDISADTKGWALGCAAENGQLPVVQYLLEQALDISAGYKGYTLARAAASGHLTVVQYLLEQALDISTGDKGYALGRAAGSGHLKVVQYLLEHAPDISIDDRKEAIGSATRNNHLEIARYIESTLEQPKPYCSM